MIAVPEPNVSTDTTGGLAMADPDELAKRFNEIVDRKNRERERGREINEQRRKSEAEKLKKRWNPEKTGFAHIHNAFKKITKEHKNNENIKIELTEMELFLRREIEDYDDTGSGLFEWWKFQFDAYEKALFQTNLLAATREAPAEITKKYYHSGNELLEDVFKILEKYI